MMTQAGELVCGYSKYDFNNCLYSVDLNTVLEPGTYIVAVDAVWDKCVSQNKLYKDIVFDVYAPEQVKISKVANDFGWNVMTKALKKLA